MSSGIAAVKIWRCSVTGCSVAASWPWSRSQNQEAALGDHRRPGDVQTILGRLEPRIRSMPPSSTSAQEVTPLPNLRSIRLCTSSKIADMPQ